MKFGDTTTGTITRFDKKGRGVFDVELGNGKRRPFLVPFTTIGDTVEVSFLKRQEGCFVGKLNRVITPGPSRITLDNTTPNPGTLWYHIHYPNQIEFKKEMIHRACEDAGHEERVHDVIACPQTNPHAPADDENAKRQYYRNRMDYVFGWQGELGLKEYGSWNRYLDLKDCVLLTPDAPKILHIFRDFLRMHPELTPWDAKRQEGDLRYVVIRDAKYTSDRLIALVVKDLSRITPNMRTALVEKLRAYTPHLVLAENPAVTDLSYGRVCCAFLRVCLKSHTYQMYTDDT